MGLKYSDVIPIGLTLPGAASDLATRELIVSARDLAKAANVHHRTARQAIECARRAGLPVRKTEPGERQIKSKPVQHHNHGVRDRVAEAVSRHLRPDGTCNSGSLGRELGMPASSVVYHLHALKVPIRSFLSVPDEARAATLAKGDASRAAIRAAIPDHLDDLGQIRIGKLARAVGLCRETVRGHLAKMPDAPPIRPPDQPKTVVVTRYDGRRVRVRCGEEARALADPRYHPRERQTIQQRIEAVRALKVGKLDRPIPENDVNAALARLEARP